MSDRDTTTVDDNRCFVCGPDNPVGLGLSFRMEDGECLAEFTPGSHHVGWHDIVHGGILFCALDDVMANWLYLQGVHGFTARCEVRYRDPLPTGTAVRLIGTPVKRKGKVVVLKGQAIRTDTARLVAECEASFLVNGEHVQRLDALF